MSDANVVTWLTFTCQLTNSGLTSQRPPAASAVTQPAVKMWFFKCDRMFCQMTFKNLLPNGLFFPQMETMSVTSGRCSICRCRLSLTLIKSIHPSNYQSNQPSIQLTIHPSINQQHFVDPSKPPTNSLQTHPSNNTPSIHPSNNTSSNHPWPPATTMKCCFWHCILKFPQRLQCCSLKKAGLQIYQIAKMCLILLWVSAQRDKISDVQLLTKCVWLVTESTTCVLESFKNSLYYIIRIKVGFERDKSAALY